MSGKGMDFRGQLKTGVNNGFFGLKVGSRFGELGGTPPPRISGSNSPGRYE